MAHVPVLLNEVLEVLDPKPGEFIIDGTIDGGGHAFVILEKIEPSGTFLGVDWDKKMLGNFKSKIQNPKSKSKIILVNDNFKNIPMILKKQNLEKADGLLLDLGFSSEQLESASWRTGRGFSFLKDEKLSMTYSDNERPAYEWLNKLKETELAKIIKDFGEERYASKIAKAVKKNLPIMTSEKLGEIVKEVVPKNYERGRIHPATRTFQALRIFVNRELENLKTVLNEITEILNPGGRFVVVSFHSLEDRIVKNVFRNLAREQRVVILTKKPIRPSREEILENPRSRSAKLRAVKIL